MACMLGLALALLALRRPLRKCRRRRPRLSLSDISHDASGDFSIQSSSLASTALIEKILDLERLVQIGPTRVQRALRGCFFCSVYCDNEFCTVIRYCALSSSKQACSSKLAQK